MELHIFQIKRSRRIGKCIIIIINEYNLASYAKHMPKYIYHSLTKGTLEDRLLR